MKKKILFVLPFCLFLLVTSALGKEKSDNNEFEKIYKDAGYTSIKEAIDSFSKNNKETISIPKNLLEYIPFNVTHSFGQFDSKKSPDIRIEYINKETGEIFFILVYPLKDEISITKPDKVGKFRNDNDQYKVVKIKDHLTFQFQSEKFSYILSSNSKSVKEENFVSIANLIKDL